MKVAIISGSVYGTAEEVARHAESLLKAAGLEAWHAARASLDDLRGFAPEALLAVTSTTGMGELPDNLMPLYATLRDVLPGEWRGLPGAVIALGDSSYGDTYCGGGEQMRELFAELGVHSRGWRNWQRCSKVDLQRSASGPRSRTRSSQACAACDR